MRVFLDLDDTLNQFTTCALSHVCGFPVTETDYPNRGSFDIVEAASRLLKHRITLYEFWSHFKRDFWAEVPKSVEFDMVLDFAEQFGRKNVCILTAQKDAMSLAGKLDWIHNYLPSWLHNQFLMGTPKHFCARGDSILIDDADKNITAFREHGGHVITVPRPWNRLYAVNTHCHLQACFEIVSSLKNYDA